MKARAFKNETIVHGKRGRYNFGRTRSKEAAASREQEIRAAERRLEAMRDGEARIAQVEDLQSQVQAGTYQVNSETVAQRMLRSAEGKRLVFSDYTLPE